MTRIYFPLRSSVELFLDPESPEPVTRAKQAAVLYDEVIFEDGLLDASLTHDGSFINYMPRGLFDEEALRLARTVYPEGSGFRLDLTINPGSADPLQPEIIFPALEGEFTGKYSAEWYTGVIDELQHVTPSWAKAFQMNDERLKAVGLAPVVDALSRSMSAVDLGAVDPIRKAFLVQSFSRDASVAARLEASVQVTSLFEPLLAGAETLALRADHPGASALAIVVPNVGNLPWEAIFAFREHPGNQEARAKLREIEEVAAAQEPSDALAFQQRVSQEITKLMFATIREVEGTGASKFVREGVNFGVSFIPFAGPILGPGASLAETARDVIHNRRSWHAALMKLRES